MVGDMCVRATRMSVCVWISINLCDYYMYLFIIYVYKKKIKGISSPFEGTVAYKYAFNVIRSL